MRLIDADELKHDLEWLECDTPVYLDVMSTIDERTTVDAAEVVRCRDCKWWDKKDNDSYGYCMAMKHAYISPNWEIGIYRTYKGDFYCADGEKKELEEEEENV